VLPQPVPRGPEDVSAEMVNALEVWRLWIGEWRRKGRK